MDSGNSGSMQSSSSGGGGGGGGDQEYESRATASTFDNAFFSSSYQSGGVGAFDNAPLLQLYSLNNNGLSSPVVFDHHPHQQVSNCFHSLESQSPNLIVNNNHENNSNNNLDMVWPNKFGSIRSPSIDANYRIINHGQPGPLTLPLHGTGVPPSLADSPRPSDQDHDGNQNHSTTTTGGPARNPKKRSRASRRAPTTVLTTDTTNFRQMVQEFTGIPAPPFSASGFPTRTRFDLDLFGGMGMGLGFQPRTGGSINTGLDVSASGVQTPPYLLRPFPQKIIPHPMKLQRTTPNTTTTTSAVAAASSSSISAVATTSSATTTATDDFHYSVLPFQSLFQSSSSSPLMPHIHPDSGIINLGSKATPSTATAHDGCGCGGGFGPRGHSNPNPDPPSWATALHQGLGLSQGDDHDHQTNCSVVNDEARNSQPTTAINATSEDRGGVIRGEGMVDSWICSSD